MKDLTKYVSCNQYFLSENFCGLEYENRRLMWQLSLICN